MEKKLKIAVIGGGISGVSVARMLHDRCRVTLFEASSRIGGLIKCDDVDGNLYHKVGGHVFNSKNQAVLDWFWSFFNKETEFESVNRNAKILMEGRQIGYPIENHLYQFDPERIRTIIGELLDAGNSLRPIEPENFQDFLLKNFGNTLFNLYFKPYNHKIWGMALDKIPLEWLEGKLPMPDLKQVVLSNIIRKAEKEMVHATFFYPKQGGSQFIIDRLADGLNIRISSPILNIERVVDGILIDDKLFDKVVYTGDVRKLGFMVKGFDSRVAEAIKANTGLHSRSTSNVLCAATHNDISWLYLPENNIDAHRIIYTGNFARSNNRSADMTTCVVEFSGEVDPKDMKKQIRYLPGNLIPLAHNYEENSYIIQENKSREQIRTLKKVLEEESIYLLGRFAEWEYYNMDKCIEAGFGVRDQILNPVQC